MAAESTGPVEKPTDPNWWLLLGRTAILVDIVAMLINLVATGLLTFYVAQFEAVASTIVRVILLTLIVDYRGRLDRGPERPGIASCRSELSSRWLSRCEGSCTSCSSDPR